MAEESAGMGGRRMRRNRGVEVECLHIWYGTEEEGNYHQKKLMNYHLELCCELKEVVQLCTTECLDEHYRHRHRHLHH